MPVVVSQITGAIKFPIGKNRQKTFKNINYIIDIRGNFDMIKIGNPIFPI